MMDFNTEEIKQLKAIEKLLDRTPRTKYLGIDKLKPDTWYHVNSRITDLAWYCGKRFYFVCVCDGWPSPEDYFSSLDSHYDIGGTIKPIVEVLLPKQFYEVNNGN